MENLTSKERVNIALRHSEPDKVPIDFGGVHTSLHVTAYKNLMEYFGLDYGEIKIQDVFQQVVFPDEKLIEKFQVDVGGAFSKPASNWEFVLDKENDEYTDEWGTTYVRPKGGFFYDIKVPAMDGFTLEELKKYKFPDPEDSARFKNLRQEVTELIDKSNKAIIFFNASWGLWESLWQMRGFEQAYMDLALSKDFLNYFWDKMLWWNTAFWGKVLEEVGDLIDVVQIGDDLGTQRGPMFSPKTYEEMLKPRHKKLVSAIKSKTNAKVYIHSCGDVSWAIGHFIDCGIDILNPVQVKASNMDSKELKKKFGKEITFWGGGCDPEILLRGTKEQIKEEVKRRIEDFAPGGGFVFASVHSIQANTPPENIATMFETAIDLRNY